ncbi:MAG: Cna B-type domain-containing protein [Clostridium sp.]
MKIYRGKKIVCLILIILLIIPVSIANAVDKEFLEGQITIRHFNKSKPIANNNFKIYKVGKILEDKIILEEEFLKCGIDFKNISEEDKLNNLGDTLEAYVHGNNIKPFKEDKTKEDGYLTFKNLNKGIYLIIADVGLGDKNIKTKPFLVTIPSKDKNTNELVNKVVINTKNEEIEKDKIDFNVEKIWINDEEKKDKPSFIEIYLYKDGVKDDSVILKETNNWKYVWKDLNSKYNWTVVEKNIPKGYEVRYEKYSTQIKIKNTYKEIGIEKPSTVLPQTGSPWMLPQGLAFTGIILIGVGWVLNRKNE